MKTDYTKFIDLIRQINDIYHNPYLTVDQKFELIFADNLFGEIEKLDVDFEWYMPDIDDDKQHELDMYVKELNDTVLSIKNKDENLKVSLGQLFPPFVDSVKYTYTYSTDSTTPKWYSGDFKILYPSDTDIKKNK